jgi:AmmeMemoRadiSam system protein B
MTTHPKLRWPLDIQAHEWESERVLVLRCPIGVVDQPLVLNAVVGPILGRLDGSRSIDSIVDEFSNQGLTRAVLDELLAVLDNGLMLASPRFFSEQRRIVDEFRESPVRKAVFAGSTYSHDPGHLRGEIDKYLGIGAGMRLPSLPWCVMAPHIDYRRGWECYGRTYAAFDGLDVDTVFLLGTAHQFSRGLFHLTSKSFDSPLGMQAVDHELVGRLASLYGPERSFQDELLHRREHSLELQIPFLRRLCPESTIVPILVGSFHHMVTKGRLPHEWEEYDSFVGALSEIFSELRAAGRRVTIVAGVDMAHVGRSFGDEEILSDEFMAHVRQRDQEYLSALEGRSKAELFRHIHSDQDRRRICGFPTMYTILDLFDRIGAMPTPKLADYRQAVDARRECGVTMAGMWFLNTAGVEEQ